MDGSRIPQSGDPVPPFTAEHVGLRARARAWIEAELRPHAAAWEAAGAFPDAVFRTLAGAGWLGLKYEREWGGAGLGYVADAVFAEELARCGSGGLAAGIGAHTGIATPPIWKFGTDAQKRRWLVPALRGEAIGALAITEPDAGSDVAAVRTRARRVEGGWVVDGAKTFITNGVRASFYVTAVKTSDEGGHRGLSFLVVERGAGVTARPLRKLGWHASDTAEVAFDGVAVPDDHLLGEPGRGFDLIMANFQWERLLMALGAVGALRIAVERMAAAGPRGQAYRHTVAGHATRTEAAAMLTYHALRRFLADARHGEAAGDEASGRGRAVREVSMAKLLSQRACVDAYEDAWRLSDGDPELERGLRDARLGPIGGGTDEIMREIVGRGYGL
jgi:acyl-CoA dehydrogenase